MELAIKKLLPFPKEEKKITNEQWYSVEKKIGFIFPSDYKSFINMYGEGGINSFLWIFSPFSENENLNLLYRAKEFKVSYETMKKEFPNDFQFNFFDGEKGILPWGITDNGDELYWNVSKENITLVIYESRYGDYREYPMKVTEFLYNLLSKSLSCDLLPDDFILEDNYYESV